MTKNNYLAPRPARAVLSLLALFLALPSPPASDGRAQGGGSAKSPAVVFAVESSGGEWMIDPVVEVGAGGRLTGAGGDEDSLKRLAADRYRPGRKLRVIFGGGDAGTLTVKQATADRECYRTGALVDAQTPARLGGNVMALATDSELLGKRAPSRREPTAAERAGVEKLARTLLARRRATPAQLRGLRTINLTATDLDGDGTAELAGTFRVNRGAASAELLFLLAESKGGNWAAALANHHPLKRADIPDPELFKEVGDSGFLSEILLDQLDLDGDGTGELFTFGRSLEGVRYKIYKRTAGRWRRLEEFYVYRCAY
ncbi:MAG TPA: hypothetical protein VK421_03305 [Pyrinomonadaceae bacterium]|nr:hypothetical protein [Pyrinomonadaceae bacterium]